MAFQSVAVRPLTGKDASVPIFEKKSKKDLIITPGKTLKTLCPTVYDISFSVRLIPDHGHLTASEQPTRWSSIQAVNCTYVT